MRMDDDLGVKILLEPRGRYTDSEEHLEKLLDGCNSDTLALNLDTGNLWLGGGDLVSFVRRFGSKIEHVHWKDMPEEHVPQRGALFGCGMATSPLGTGVIDIQGTFDALVATGFKGYTTLEVAGEAAVLQSYDYLKSLGAN